VPAVLIGSMLSSRAPDKYIRPAITFVIFASGLKYVGMGTTALGWTLCGVLLAGGVYWLWRNRGKAEAEPAREPEAEVLRRLPVLGVGRRGLRGRFSAAVLRNTAEKSPRAAPPHGVIGVATEIAPSASASRSHRVTPPREKYRQPRAESGAS